MQLSVSQYGRLIYIAQNEIGFLNFVSKMLPILHCPFSNCHNHDKSQKEFKVTSVLIQYVTFKILFLSYATDCKAK